MADWTFVPVPGPTFMGVALFGFAPLALVLYGWLVVLFAKGVARTTALALFLAGPPAAMIAATLLGVDTALPFTLYMAAAALAVPIENAMGRSRRIERRWVGAVPTAIVALWLPVWVSAEASKAV